MTDPAEMELDVEELRAWCGSVASNVNQDPMSHDEQQVVAARILALLDSHARLVAEQLAMSVNLGGEIVALRGDLDAKDVEIAQLEGEKARLQRVVDAAAQVNMTLKGGFVVCAHCGEQEDTTDMDYAPELDAALAALTESSPSTETGEKT
jgi:hypothetical protein